MGYEILQKHDETLRDRSVICVGVSWDLCSKEDLFDIVKVGCTPFWKWKLTPLCVSVSGETL